MPLILEIKDQTGQRAKAYAGAWETLTACMQIIDKEKGEKGAWGSLQGPHKVENCYKWTVESREGKKIEVTVEPGYTINMYR